MKDDVKETQVHSNSARSGADDKPRDASEDGKLSVRCTVNGEAVTLTAYPLARLLDVLREELRLTGTKEGCGEGECGACSVILDGELVNSCLIPIVQAEGARILTIEGVADGERLHAVQQAMIECGGAQCGICTPGMVLAALNLLKQTPDPSEADIREGLAGNLCRCTGYMKIFDAVVRACGEGMRATR
ncbi:MAG: aerobic carbon-monoxide dehydrogenase small subunit [Acidobacteriota bacterium]|jgi:carbon-monoxide dehydrogenase small subunit|nr:aerobic carbon-monoxide dehydrogenase small subunit [Acidobacteriota bacterium]